MTGSPASPGSHSNRKTEGITRISVCGYKSVAERQSIEIRPLTILAGANSSGKSSMIQPLLLLKQTLEASYDPGPLLLDGPNLRFTSVDQLLTCCRVPGEKGGFSVGLEVGTGRELTLFFQKVGNKGLQIEEMTFASQQERGTLRETMTKEELMAVLPSQYKDIKVAGNGGKKNIVEWTVTRDRCFLAARMLIGGKLVGTEFPFIISPAAIAEPHIRRLIHLPGLRGNPRRLYPKTAVGSTFPGVFQDYTASLIAQWQDTQKEKLENLSRDLHELGLTWKVIARPIDDTQVEVKVGRLPQAVAGGGWDLVNIADVGFGLSQTLPVLVALHAAEPGQIVYLEQPEIHLHPKAQLAMARVLADAAMRGVGVVAETHSALLLKGIQALVAEDKLPRDKVKLHWFKRAEDGCTQITPADVDEHGAFGDWPEDFATTELEAENRYLDAVEKEQGKVQNG